MKKIYSFLLMLLCLTTAHAYTSPYNDLGRTLSRSFKVSGGVGIKQFAQALDDVLPIEMEQATVDQQNGFINYHMEGDGGYHVEMALWNRKDGRKLFVVSYRISESVVDDMKPGQSTDCHFSQIEDIGFGKFLYNVGYRAYLYDAASAMLNPTPLGVEGTNWNNGGEEPFYLILPQKGKNLEVNIGIDAAPETNVLKWNGMGWTYENTNFMEVYIHDKTYPVNVRHKPGGDVVHKLDEGDMIYVDRCENGWFHIHLGFYYHNSEERQFDYEGDKWVHRSVVRVDWTGYSSRTLLAQPAANAAIVFRGHQGSENPKELITELLDLKGDYAKIRLANGKTGWIEYHELCGNSLTTCP